jgi:AcrR family transcriptional regulator
LNRFGDLAEYTPKLVAVRPQAEDKRGLLLAAAVRVFARKGYHTCRVGDIAKEAGVAYGLLYHYFSSKDEVLQTIFRDTWTQMLETTRSIEATGEPAREQLRRRTGRSGGGDKQSRDRRLRKTRSGSPRSLDPFSTRQRLVPLL